MQLLILATALMYAAGGGYNETTKILIDAKADINIVVKATTEYKEQVLQSLLEGKEGVEPHKDGVTALIVAAQEGHIGTAKLLIDASPSSIMCTTPTGQTAMHLAADFSQPNTQMVKLLIKRCPESVQIQDSEVPIH